MEKNGGEMYLRNLKCGGKSKKVKKKEDGEKIEKSKPARLSKGKKLCPCRLAKVGGQIVEVDCEGNVVWNKQGGQMVIKAKYGLTLGNQTLNFGNRHLKTKDDILAMQGMKSGDIHYYYDPTSKRVMLMKYSESGWEDPTNAVFTRTVEGSTQPETYTPIYGQGEGEINLWKDGYDLNTGLMEGETVTRNYGNGVIGTTKTLANTNNSPLVRDKERGFVLQTGDDKQNQSAKLTYNTSQMARIARADRRANYWANREAGYTKEEAKNALRQERHRDRNTIWGTQYKGDAENIYGNDYQAIQQGANSYSDIYRINKRSRANKAKVFNMSSAPSTTISSAPATTTPAAPAASSTVTLPPMKGNTLFSKQGGWLTKF